MGNPWALTEWQKEIDSYLIGTTRLYGFVTPKQFLLVFNRYHEPKLLKSELTHTIQEDKLRKYFLIKSLCTGLHITNSNSQSSAGIRGT